MKSTYFVPVGTGYVLLNWKWDHAEKQTESKTFDRRQRRFPVMLTWDAELIFRTITAFVSSTSLQDNFIFAL